jgi:acetamidase/formamidase
VSGELPHAHSIHSVSAEHRQTVWDNQIPPVLEVDSGETVQLETADASGGQLTKSSTAEDVTKMDLNNVNPVTGPVYVKGAEPGDTLQIEILELAPNDWGWTAIIPEFGLLADEFPDPWLNISTVDATTNSVRFNDQVTLPFAPFPGTIGVAPQEPGQHSVLPPTKWGGNMDIKHLTAGTVLYLPVAADGALFSVGDTHAAMGDGEVCGTAIESAMTITVRLTTLKHVEIPFPRYRIPPGQLAQAEQSGHDVCTGIDPDLTEAAKQAIRATIEHIQQTHGIDHQTAYAIASVAVDLRIHELVDAPNWVVGAFLPDAIFTGPGS